MHISSLSFLSTRRSWMPSAVLLALTACGGGGDNSPTDAADTSAAASAEPTVVLEAVPPKATDTVQAVTSTDIRYTLSFGGQTRSYRVIRPDSCTGDCPVVIDLHGFTSNGMAQRDRSGTREVGEANGVITVFPNGASGSWAAGSGPYGSCCGLSESTGVDDVGFIRAMIDQVRADYGVIDPKRIYATGLSNGCAMAQRLAAEAGDVVAAVACSSLYLLTGQTALARPISVTEIHGLQDYSVSYPQSVFWTGAQNNFKRWATLNGCVGTPVKTQLTPGSYVERYSRCVAGVQVTLYSIQSGHITYSNTDGIEVAQITWDSLKDTRLP